jgi:hypothetical protein
MSLENPGNRRDRDPSLSQTTSRRPKSYRLPKWCNPRRGFLPARWAEPIEPAEEDALPQAEIVDRGIPYVDPLSEAGDLFSPGAYSDPFAAGSYAQPLAAPPPQAAPKPIRKKRRRHAPDGGGVGFSNWVAYAVLFLILPASAIFTVLGIVQGRRGGVPPPQAAPNGRPPSLPRGPASATGHPIRVSSVTTRAASDDFTMEYQLTGAVNQASQYFWVVSCPQGRIEFPIPGNSWQPNGNLSGKPTAAANLSPPYTSHIEEQTGPTRTRVSNEVTVVVDG